MARARVLVCGGGNMGRNHLRVLGTLPEACEVAGVVEPSAQARQRLVGAPAFPLYEALEPALEASAPDAVIVATPTRTHHAIASLLLERRIPFLVEKPVALGHDEGAELSRRAEQAGVPAMVGHVERFNPAVVAVRRLILDGQLGAVVHISARRVGGTPQDVLKAGDVLVDLAVHDIDIAQWLLGPLQLEATSGHYTLLEDRRLIDSATMLLRAGDATVDVHVNWVTPIKIRSLTVTGTEGHVEANLITQQVTLTRKNPVLASGKPTGDGFFDDYLLSFAAPDSTQVGILKREPLREELRAFLAALHAPDPCAAMPIPLSHGVSALELAERARHKLAGS